MAAITAVADVPTASVQVTVDARLVIDTFTRVVAAAWGTPDFGPAYTTIGGAAADFSVTGTQGQVQHTNVNVARRTTTGGAVLNPTQLITLIPGVVALGAPISMGLIARQTLGNDYIAEVHFGLAGVMSLRLRRNVAGVVTTLTTVALPGTYGAGTQMLLRFAMDGQTLMAKAWDSTGVEPVDWQTTFTDPNLTTVGAIGTRSILELGNANVLPVNLRFDNYTACNNGDRLLRVYPDGDTALVRGSPFLLSGCLGVFYDTEAPLNTAVHYQFATTSGSVSDTSNTVVIESGEDGWLKDPLRPYNDIKMDNCAVHSVQCLSTDANIFFQRLEPEVYDSASGVFEIVDNPRPNVIAMTRKDQHSVLGIVSRKLSDITRIRTLLSPGGPLLLQLPTRYGWGIETWGSDYLQVYDNSARRLGPDMGKPYRDWSLPFTAARAPTDVHSGGTGGGSIGVPGFLYRDSTATGRTYAQSTALGRTYLVRTQHPTF